MRTEKEVLQMILDFAENRDDIRMVAMDGSRTNPNVTKDHYQDYDIVFIVNDMDDWKNNKDWISTFGELLIMQEPESGSLWPNSLGNWYSFLMQFRDGVRIDLILVPLEEQLLYLKSDSLMQILLDKDHIVNESIVSSEENYLVRKPTEDNYKDSCIEFYWVSLYVHKAIQRTEQIYAIDHLNIVRDELLRMIGWQIAYTYDYTINLGKSYKWLEKYLDKKTWKKLISTYHVSTYQDIEKSLLTCFDLFKKAAVEVAENLGYEYPEQYHKDILEFMANSSTIYKTEDV